MANVNIDWPNLGFNYQPITKRYVANYKDGHWEKGGLTEDATIVLNECAGILQYCQEVFEGLKAYRTKDGRIVTFRPDLNAKRMMDSAKRLVMPPVPEETLPHVLISDGMIRENELASAGIRRETLDGFLRAQGVDGAERVLLCELDSRGTVFLQLRGAGQSARRVLWKEAAKCAGA